MTADILLTALEGLNPVQFYEWSVVTCLLEKGYTSNEIPDMIERSPLTKAMRHPQLCWSFRHDMDYNDWTAIVERDNEKLKNNEKLLYADDIAALCG